MASEVNRSIASYRRGGRPFVLFLSSLSCPGSTRRVGLETAGAKTSLMPSHRLSVAGDGLLPVQAKIWAEEYATDGQLALSRRYVAHPDFMCRVPIIEKRTLESSPISASASRHAERSPIGVQRIFTFGH
jgi:hypothetical protein